MNKKKEKKKQHMLATGWVDETSIITICFYRFGRK